MRNKIEETGIMIDLIQASVIDERIDIKEEGFLENIEDSYYYINEESESEVEQNASKSNSSPKLDKSDYFDCSSKLTNGQIARYSHEWEINDLNCDQARILGKPNDFNFNKGSKLQGHDNRLHKNRNAGYETNSSRSLALTFKKWIRCDICNKAFAYACLLAQHKLVHLGIKKYNCQLCNKAFSQLGNLNVHLLIHRGIKNYQCDVCNRAFTQSSNLNQHKLIHSGIKKFKCDICNEAFAQTSTLKRHKLIHMGIKNYKCDVCEKVFRQSGTLHNHKLIHSEVKQFECEICRKAFSQPRLLKTHKSVHTCDV